MKSFLIALTFFAVLISCDWTTIATLDDFGGDQSIIVVVNGAFPATASGFYTSSSVVGGERDLQLVVDSGSVGQVYIDTVTSDELRLSSASGGTSHTIYQLDGPDNSVDIDENGLDGFDLTFGGTANAFQFTAQSDIDTFLTITVYTSTGSGGARLNIPASIGSTDYYLLFSDLDGTLDLTSVGAIEISFDGRDSVDAVFEFFGVAQGFRDTITIVSNSWSTVDFPTTGGVVISTWSPFSSFTPGIVTRDTLPVTGLGNTLPGDSSDVAASEKAGSAGITTNLSTAVTTDLSTVNVKTSHSSRPVHHHNSSDDSSSVAFLPCLAFTVFLLFVLC